MSISTLSQFIPFAYKLILMICISLGLLSYMLSTCKDARKKWIHLQRLHQIPCSHCLFFTDEYNLNCAVHPYKALSEEAIGCADYQAAQTGSVNDPKV